MQYVFLIYQDERTESALDHTRFAVAGPIAHVLARHRLSAGYLATTVRATPHGDIVFDGPFAATDDQLRGLYVVEATDLDDALRSAKLLARSAAGVEIRPLSPSG